MTGWLSGSLLVVLLLWVLILAPLFLLRKPPVRRVSQVLNDTRVLYRGGSETVAKPKSRLPQGYYVHEGDEELELVEAEPEYMIIDDTQDDPHDAYESAHYELDVITAPESFSYDSGSFEEEVPEVIVPESTLSPVDTVYAEEDTSVSAPILDAEVVEEDKEPLVLVEDSPLSKEETLESDPPKKEEHRRNTTIPSYYERSSDRDIYSPSVDEVIEFSENTPAQMMDEDSLEASDEDLAYAASRRGRGVFDPVASQALAQQRLLKRRRALGLLIVIMVLSVISALIFHGWVWYLSLSSFILTGVYLYYLRKQAVEEAELRRRRLARMRRARLGVRNVDDSELGVPDRLLRPGAVVVEVNDPDPDFAHLDYIDFSIYRENIQDEDESAVNNLEQAQNVG